MKCVQYWFLVSHLFKYINTHNSFTLSPRGRGFGQCVSALTNTELLEVRGTAVLRVKP